MTTINPHEVGKFSHQDWWNYDSLESKMLHRLNILRMKFLRSLVTINGLDVLDVGCGGGIASESLSAVGANVTAIDASAEAITCAKEHAQKGGLKIDYQNTPIENFNAGKKFDVVFANDIIEHVDCVPMFLENIEQNVKTNGLLIISTINKNPASFLLAKVLPEFVLNLVPKGTHDYAKFITPKFLREFLGGEFTHLKTQGFSYNPLGKAFFFEPTALANYFIVFRKK